MRRERGHAAALALLSPANVQRLAFFKECSANLYKQKLFKKKIFHIKKKKSPQSYSGKPEAPSGINGLRWADTYILHVCWCWVDGWGRMQIFNVVTELDWMFYGLSLSWQRATACKSNWKEGNEGVGTPLYQGTWLQKENLALHYTARWIYLGHWNRHRFRWKGTIFLIWHHDL